MGMTLTGKSGESYRFEGPFSTTDKIDDNSGLYAIAYEAEPKKWKVIDVGESKNVKTRLDTHDRMECWEKHSPDGFEYFVHFIEHGKKPSRLDAEQDLRNHRKLPCGDK